jgi:hypothetical protein
MKNLLAAHQFPKKAQESRIGILASLQVSQFRKDGDVWSEGIKKEKMTSGKRKVPPHQRVVESDLLKYVQEVKGVEHTTVPAPKAGARTAIQRTAAAGLGSTQTS